MGDNMDEQLTGDGPSILDMARSRLAGAERIVNTAEAKRGENFTDPIQVRSIANAAGAESAANGTDPDQAQSETPSREAYIERINYLKAFKNYTESSIEI